MRTALVVLFIGATFAAATPACNKLTCRGEDQTCDEETLLCSRGYYCTGLTLNNTVGTCKAPLARGVACTDDKQCAYQDGDHCSRSNQVCRAPFNAGETCEDEVQCDIGHTCSSGVCTKMYSVANGAACTINWACTKGSLCVANVCTAYLTEGAACSTTNDRCANDLFCAIDTAKCAKYGSLAEGAYCRASYECSTGAICGHDDKCVKVAATDKSTPACNKTNDCTADKECICDPRDGVRKCVVITPSSSGLVDDWIDFHECDREGLADAYWVCDSEYRDLTDKLYGFDVAKAQCSGAASVAVSTAALLAVILAALL